MLHELLTTCPGSHGPHSFKFSLLAKLFNLTAADQANAQQIVACFIKTLKEAKDAERTKHVKEIAQTICTIPYAKFSDALGDAFSLKAGMCESMPYLLMLMVRSISTIVTDNKVESKRISVLDAAYNIFDMAMAQEGRHSFKFIFLLHLFEYRLKTGIKPKSINRDTMHACLYINQDNKTAISNFLFSVFAKGDKEESFFIINELINELATIKKDLYSKRYYEVAGFVDQCFKGNTTRDSLCTTIRNVINDWNIAESDKQESRSPIEGFFARVGTANKRSHREQDIDALLTSIESPLINPLVALVQFLKEGAGSSGPHSFKYLLLVKLFPALTADATEAESTSTIKLFIDIGMKTIKQAPKDVPLEVKRVNAATST